MIFAGQLYCRDIYTCCALIPQEDAEYCSLCLALSHMETRMLCLASWLEQAGPLSDHSCRCTVNVFPCSRGSQQGLIATKPSVIQECNYLLTQIIYLAGSPYPSHRAASTCQQTLLYPLSLFIFSLSLILRHTADVWQVARDALIKSSCFWQSNMSVHGISECYTVVLNQ